MGVMMFVRIARLGLLLGISAAFLLNWLPFVRGPLDGVTYEWGQTFFGHTLSGSGTGGDYPFVAGMVVLGLTLLFSGWRGGGPVFQGLALIWSGVMLADSLYGRFVLGQDVTFNGDTLGVSTSVTDIFMAAYGLMFVLALAWTIGGRPRPVAPWGVANTALVATAVLLAPLQFALLSTGQGRELSDQYGVLITIAQWLLICVAFAPFGSDRRSAPRLAS